MPVGGIPLGLGMVMKINFFEFSCMHIAWSVITYNNYSKKKVFISELPPIYTSHCGAFNHIFLSLARKKTNI